MAVETSISPMQKLSSLAYQLLLNYVTPSDQTDSFSASHQRFLPYPDYLLFADVQLSCLINLQGAAEKGAAREF